MKKNKTVGFTTILLLLGLIVSSSALAVVPPPPSQGPNNGSSFAGNISAPSGNADWANANRVATSDNSYATVTITSSGDVSNYLRVSGFNFNIPAGATIKGILANIEKSDFSTVGTSHITDHVVSLVKNNVVTGNNKASLSNWTGSDATSTYGSTSDLWGSTWTPSDINNANFGLVLSVGRTSGGDKQARVDHVSLVVYYTPDTTAPTSTITAPETGSLLKGVVNLTATSSDSESGVAKVEFWHASPVNVKIGEATTSPYSINLDTSTMTDGAHDIWVEAYDKAGNHATSAAISVTIDNTAPTLHLPENISLEATNHDGELINFETSASDVNPESPAVTCDPISGSTFKVGTTTISCMATDTAGNVATGTFTIEVKDTTKPIITPPENQTFEATGPLTTPIGLIQATSTDIADINPVINHTPTEFPLGDTEVTWTATDASGNQASATSSVTITDTTAPLISLIGNNPFDMYINKDYSVLNPEPDYTVSDLVDGDNITGHVAVTVTGKDFDNTVLGSHAITYSAVDLSGNRTTSTRIVNIVNTDRPIIYRKGLSPVTVERGTTYVDAGATATDRDGSDITSLIKTNIETAPIDTSVVGTSTVTYDVTGADLGEYTGTSTADQAKRIVRVIDTTAPTATVDYSPATPTNGHVTATITPDEPVTITNNEGSNTYTFTDNGSFTFNFVDPSGNTGSTTATVTNIDRESPTINSVQAISSTTVEVIFNEDLQNNLEGHHPAISDFNIYNDLDKSNNLDEGDASYGISNVSYDLKKATLTLTEPLKPGDTPRLYVTPEDTTLIDIAGNLFNHGASFDTSVSDKIIPVLTLIGNNPINLTVGDTYTEQGATSTDIFSGVTEPINISGTVNTNTAGVYTITYSVADTASNTAAEITRTINVAARIPSGGGGGGGGGGSSFVSTFNAPTGGFQIVINNGDLDTNATSVNLKLNGGTATRMSISNINDFSNSSQEAYADTKSWQLLPGAGLKTVYAKFFDLNGTASAVVKDDILLNDNSNPIITTPPTQQVLGEKKYADGTLLKNHNRIYVVTGGKLLYIPNLKELAKYHGPILKVDDSVINSFVQLYPNGTLLRAQDDVKIYVILNGHKVHLKTMAELRKYRGPIIVVTPDELNNY
ncbi:MAG: immunoglobulin-like domain-containing protein [Candidatus Falkowbacteria bacterium]